MADNGTQDMRAPAWKWEWNINTVALLVGFGTGLIAWGVTWGQVQSNQTQQAQATEKLDRRLTTVEADARRLDTQDLRISVLERQAGDAALSLRSVEATLNDLATDVKVTREILQRLEASQDSKLKP